MSYLYSKKTLVILGFVILLIMPFVLAPFNLNLLGRFLAYAILALGIGVLWGYAGILSLGHGIFFGFGAYAMAMYLTLQSGGMPDFMGWNGITELPWFWAIFSNPIVAIVLAIAVPMLFAGILGFFTFRNRITGVYFTILTQALVIVVTTLIISQQQYTGGTNGITGFDTIFGYSLNSVTTQQMIYWTTVIFLGLVFLICYKLVNSRFGKVLIAIRDGENRTRFLGYNTSIYQVIVYSFSAGVAGLAGMLFVLQVGIITPSMMGIVPSIEMVLWVAIGGRGTLIGPVIGALLTNGASTWFSQTYPDAWLFFIGLVFVLVVVFMPKGIMGIISTIQARRRAKKYGKDRKEEAKLYNSSSI
ncbi:urea ABC transporter permease subunit UrtC [Geomicrobium sediminis]|uniref:Urea transport system permease protein n=1 Tax=Geomicrobium sediminis TaxID=1347788 RepID=A0ABS2PEN8_9BACL|nr:urea ABC transporter permease subunit UrtC [Geomicrobium sediminis]MBM7633283.1 urea transport system permease protein [Geomicrobium sediminis]